MKMKRSFGLMSISALGALQLAICSAPAQTSYYVLTNASQVVSGGWGNWFGSAFYQVIGVTNDANGDPNSGSMQMVSYYPDSGLGTGGGPQFVLYNGNDGFSPPLVGNGGSPTAALATNVEFDVMFDPASFYITNNNDWPTIEVGTRGIDYGQHDFGTFTISHDVTNWVHVVIPIGPDSSWTNIPNMYWKYYTTMYTNINDPQYFSIYLDNVKFTQAAVPIVPPTMAVEPATTGLRIFAGSTAQTYDREHITAVDTNQSWVGGTYPVSYSYTLQNFPVAPNDQQAIFRFHIFLIPVAYVGGNSLTGNEYLEYQAGDDLWLNISTMNGITNGVQAQLAWKTNTPNANPGNIPLEFTNATAVGTWTLTFSNATSGAVFAPGSGAHPFTIPAAAAARFANPLVAQFGVQPDSGWGEGKYADVASIQTVGVASPGVPISSDFLTTPLDTNVWYIGNSAQTNSIVYVGANEAWWVNWSYPDYGADLQTKADLSSSIPWETPLYYTGQTNQLFQGKMGPSVWQLVPSSGLPTVDGTTNGVKSDNVYFRLKATL